MPARDKVHQQVVNALRKDGWTITHDPFKVAWKKRKLQIDLGAERLVAAQKGDDKIAVEIKSFVGANDLEDLYQALGQFILYRKALGVEAPNRTLFLAIKVETYQEMFADKEGESLRAGEGINILVVHTNLEEIVLWKQ
jgi:hypothetical protein